MVTVAACSKVNTHSFNEHLVVLQLQYFIVAQLLTLDSPGQEADQGQEGICSRGPQTKRFTESDILGLLGIGRIEVEH